MFNFEPVKESVICQNRPVYAQGVIFFTGCERFCPVIVFSDAKNRSVYTPDVNFITGVNETVLKQIIKPVYITQFAISVCYITVCIGLTYVTQIGIPINTKSVT